MPLFTPRRLASLGLVSAFLSGCSGDVDRLQAVAPIYVPSSNASAQRSDRVRAAYSDCPAPSVGLHPLPR